ncbi:MAG: hypothetical protein HYZ58_08615 [Acidobacteria bacterium]|nr:hypothetical protein [Acidobacteriota bacterium]
MVRIASGSISLVVGDRLPSLAVRPAVANASSNRASPWNSVTIRNGVRDGNAAPTPHRSPFDRSSASGVSGSPRTITPPTPLSSTRSFTSPLTIASTSTSGFPVLVPAAVSPVGTFTIPRSATAAGCCRHGARRLIFAPSIRSPTWSPVQPSRTNGSSLTSPPTAGWLVKSGRTSRSTRVSTRNEPNSSARSRTPTPTVTAKCEMSVKPCSRS